MPTTNDSPAPVPRRQRYALPAWVVVLAFSACGAGCGEDKNDNERSCEERGNLLCERACACAEADLCLISHDGNTIGFDSVADCRSLYMGVGCGPDGPPVADDAGCRAAIEGAACVMTVDGVAVEYPLVDACEHTPR
jgi:hypothetical protein